MPPVDLSTVSLDSGNILADLGLQNDSASSPDAAISDANVVTDLTAVDGPLPYPFKVCGDQGKWC